MKDRRDTQGWSNLLIKKCLSGLTKLNSSCCIVQVVILVIDLYPGVALSSPITTGHTRIAKREIGSKWLPGTQH